MTTLICNCNQTMPLDAVALSQALDEPLTLHSTLCRREAAAFQKAVRNPDELVVACTQERRLVPGRFFRKDLAQVFRLCRRAGAARAKQINAQQQGRPAQHRRFKHGRHG